ncbi:MAG: cytosine permease [Thermaerobacter sp.]|nr:cytosine permease [Bacillota bacterium]REJ38333.1 MAG: cytosine permease [Bacillota bacterium]
MSVHAAPQAAGNAVHVDPDYPLAQVPASARRNFWSLTVVLLGFTFFTPTMLAGAQVGAAFTFGEFLSVLVVGSLILGGYVGALSAVGAHTGLTTVLMSRYTLGTAGAKWADLLLGGTQVGWYGVTAATFGELVAQAFGLQQYTWLLMILGGVLMGITAYYGYRGMEILSYVSVPMLFILAFWVTARSLDEVGGWAGMFAQRPVETMTWATAITIIVGTFASGGTQTPNWSRFSKSWQQALLAGLIAFFLGNGVMLFFGAVGAIAFQEADFVNVLMKMGLVFWGLVFMVLNLWTTNDNTAYAFGVAGAEFFNVPTKKPFIIGGIVIGIILAITGIYNALIAWLSFLGTFIPPLGGVILGDYLFYWRGKLPPLESMRFRTVRWSAVVAYLLGTAAAYFGGLAGIGIPPLNGIIVAGLALPVCEAIFRALGAEQKHEVA